MSKLRGDESTLHRRDVALLAMARVAAGPDLLGAWRDGDGATIRRVATRQLARQAHAAAMLGPAAARLAGGIPLVPLLALGGPFGPAWAGHGLASDGLHERIRLREPDLTGELARLMGPAAGWRGPQRARSFLRILAEVTGVDGLSAALAEDTRPTVTAEHPIMGPRRGPAPTEAGGRIAHLRLDLLFEWALGPGRQRAVVAVEAKLGATVSEGQLRPYGREARRRARGGPVTLILLTAVPDAAERRHRAWHPVRWFALLRRWEATLAEAGDTDPAFARLRARLWRTLLDNPRSLR